MSLRLQIERGLILPVWQHHAEACDNLLVRHELLLVWGMSRWRQQLVRNGDKFGLEDN